MASTDRLHRLAGEILSEFRRTGRAGVPGYKGFRFLRETEEAIHVTREGGQVARVPFSRLNIAIAAAVENPDVYEGGPSKLREYGLTHVTSPIWALLRVLPRERYAKIARSRA